LLEQAFCCCQQGVPGPVFLECPLDLLYPESVVRQWYGIKAPQGGLGERAVQLYLRRHVIDLFAGADRAHAGPRRAIAPPVPDPALISKAGERLARAQRPVLLVGSQALLEAGRVAELAAAIGRIGAPVYLSGMARGLLGRDHPLQMRHNRRAALREADLVLLAGVPCDFRLDYGRHIPRRAFYVSANRSRSDLNRNRRPDLGILGDPGLFLTALARALPQVERWADWRGQLQAREVARDAEIGEQARQPVGGVNPLSLLRDVDVQLPAGAIVVADGGDFVGTASYIVRPTGPLAWLDPGVFGTLGVGAGFALGAKLCHPEAEVWVLYGDGALGFSLAEMDTFARHGIPVIAVVGNDARWSQIAREQVDMLGDEVGTALARTEYHRAAEGFGATGFLLDDAELATEVLGQAQSVAAAGKPVLVNAMIGRTDFRKGSISM
jgi:acetolactate synthase-1/2/3 large subunit